MSEGVEEEEDMDVGFGGTGTLLKTGVLLRLSADGPRQAAPLFCWPLNSFPGSATGFGFNSELGI